MAKKEQKEPFSLHRDKFSWNDGDIEWIDRTDSSESSAAAVLIIKDGKILCGTRRNKEGVCGPGGHIEAGETPEQAAVREAQEEFNITPLNLHPLGDYKASYQRYEDSKLYWTDQFTGEPQTDDDEMFIARWMTLDELRDLVLFPPFEASLDMLENFLGNYLTIRKSTDTIKSEGNNDGAPPGNQNAAGAHKSKGKAADYKAARDYTKEIAGTKTVDGITMKKVSLHAAHRMKQRGITTDYAKEILTKPDATYKGNSTNSEAHCYQLKNSRMVVSEEGVLISAITLNGRNGE